MDETYFQNRFVKALIFSGSGGEFLLPYVCVGGSLSRWFQLNPAYAREEDRELGQRCRGVAARFTFVMKPKRGLRRRQVPT